MVGLVVAMALVAAASDRGCVAVLEGRGPPAAATVVSTVGSTAEYVVGEAGRFCRHGIQRVLCDRIPCKMAFLTTVAGSVGVLAVGGMRAASGCVCGDALAGCGQMSSPLAAFNSATVQPAAWRMPIAASCAWVGAAPRCMAVPRMC